MPNPFFGNPAFGALSTQPNTTRGQLLRPYPQFGNVFAHHAGEYDGSCGCVRWLNPAAWSAAAPFTFGDAPRVDPRVRTPARNNWNLAVQKAERFGATTLTLRAEIINLFDSPDLTGPAIGFGLPNFGQILNSGGVARTIQLMARLSF